MYVEPVIVPVTPMSWVTFIFHSAEGYVGEEMFLTTATLSTVRSFGGRPRTRAIGYPKVRALYQTLKGRHYRIVYHRHMHAMSPEGVRRAEEEQCAEAMRIVR